MDILKEFCDAIKIESSENIKKHEEEEKLPLNEKIDKGVTMSNLKVEFDFDDGLPNKWCNPLSDSEKYISSAKIFCDNNISNFKEGDSVVLSQGEYKFKMDIEEDSAENFILKPDHHNRKCCHIDYKDYPKNNWEINKVKTGTGDLLLEAAKELKDNDSTCHKIDKFLNGRTRNSFGHYSQKVHSLDDSQNTAYLKAINASDFCIIQGPPGTGKTETIANITKHLIDSGLKVFITAPTHTAINNCLNAISEKLKDCGKVIKIGKKARGKEVQENQFVTKESKVPYNSDYSKKGIAIGATAYSLCYPRSKQLEGWTFDVVIIDEASQLSIPLSIAAMFRAGKYIFVGDHKQLDPIIPKDSNNEMFAESVFSRLARLYPDEINLLNTSYRLNESLIKIPNTLFYGNLLQSAASTTEDNTIYQCNYQSQILNSEAHKLILHEVFDGKHRSPFEAKLVKELVSDLLRNGVKIDEIGIMAPYRAQVREIMKEVNKIIPKPSKTLFIDTVDSMQGQERNYIIYSLANSHPLESMRRLDFFYSPNRLNVAITRAIKKCFVIANYKVFDINDDELKKHPDIKNSFDIFKQYYSLSSKFEIDSPDESDW